MSRRTISSDAPWEIKVGYSRAVQAGDRLYISGTTSAVNGEVTGVGDAYQQTRIILEKISRTLEQAGFHLNDVIRTRMYVTDISRWEEYGRAHAEFFGEIRPATSMVEVARLIDPDMLIEIEIDADKS